MQSLFPFAHIIAGIIILIVGFGFHFLGQLMGFLYWEPELKHSFIINMPIKAKGYAHIVAISDVAIGWSYAIIGMGMYIGKSWSYTLAWIPGIILFLEGISFWTWRNQNNRPAQDLSLTERIEWSGLNIVSGLFILLVAWSAL